MRKVLTLTLFLAISFVSIGQNWLGEIPSERRDNLNFNDLQKAFYSYWDVHEHEEGQAIKQFKRYEWYMAPRVNEDGVIPTNILLKEINAINQQRQGGTKNNSDWMPLGPFDTPDWMNEGLRSGSGRIDCAAFHPDNDNIMWVGAHSGGFWKTTDGGQSWYTTTDHLGSIGISSIVVHPDDTDMLYISTGDRDSWNTFSIGVLKSYDGGETWEETGMTYEVYQNQVINSMIQNPLHPDVLYISTETGIYKSTNAAVDWYKVANGHFKEIHFKQGNTNILFATSFNYYGGAQIYKSEDAGETFQPLSNTGIPPSQVSRIALGMTPADTEVIYALCSRNYPNAYCYGVFKSVNGGDTWTKELDGNEINLLGRSVYGSDQEGYGWYTLSIAVSPVNPNELYTGAINIWKSVDGARNWEIKTHEVNNIIPGVTYSWVDHHFMGYKPNTNILYSGNDGGIMRSIDGGDNWEDLSDGLEILQIYKIALSASDESVALCGDQDQFAMYMHDNTWHCLRTGESGENLIDYSDPQTFYTSGYGGGFKRTYNGGNYLSNITPPGVSLYVWLWPFAMHPYDVNTIYICTNIIHKSINQGSSWTQLDPGLLVSELSLFEIAPSNDKYIVTGTSNILYRTENGGIDWGNIKGNLPNGNISDVIISPNNTEIMFVSFSGFNSGMKVYKTINGGESWENISYNLPNLPANCIVYQNGTNDGIYVGMDVGVYYIDNNMEEWTDFSNGLPNVIVNEIEIQYNTEKIRAGTYGRGLWESPLYYSPVDISENQVSSLFKIYPNPSNGIIYVDSYSKVHGKSTVNIYNETGQQIHHKELNNNILYLSEKIDLTSLCKGVYLIEILTNDQLYRKKLIIQ